MTETRPDRLDDLARNLTERLDTIEREVARLTAPSPDSPVDQATTELVEAVRAMYRTPHAFPPSDHRAQRRADDSRSAVYAALRTGQPKPNDRRTCRVCALPVGGHQLGACPICGDALEHHPDGRPTDAEWEGRARMAHAREQAGEPLTSTDYEAIARHPDPPSIFDQEAHHGMG